MFADSMVFLDFHAQPPNAVVDLPRHLALSHVTAAPPQLTTTGEIVVAVSGFSSTITGQPHLSLVRRGLDVESLETMTRERTGVVLGLQSAPHDADVVNLRRLFEAGIRIIAISYRSADHPLGSGFDDMRRGLSDQGRQFIRDCAEVGLIVDLSHSGHETARQTLRLIDDEQLPLRVMASHGGCYEVYQDPRNMPDDVLKGVADNGGVVGIFSLTFSLHARYNTPNPMLRHILHAMGVCGAGNVAIGSDGIYRNLGQEEWKKHIEWMQESFDSDGRLKSRWPDTPPVLNGADRMARLDRLMKSAGFGEMERGAVLGRNLVRFLKEALP